MTQLSIADMVRKVGLRIGLRISQSPIGSQDMQIQQLVELFNEEVYELGTKYRWQALTKEGSFVTVATEDQGVFFGAGGVLAESTQYNHIISETMWDRTSRQPIPGPESSFDWQARKALQYTSGPFPNYRILGNRLFLSPIPAAGHSVYFEFSSKAFVYNPGDDTYGPTFTANESVPVLDSDIIMAGVRWRWKAAKGFQYTEEKRTYELDAATASSRDSGRKTLSLGGGNTVLAPGRRSGDLTTHAI